MALYQLVDKIRWSNFKMKLLGGIVMVALCRYKLQLVRVAQKIIKQRVHYQ